MAKNTYMPVLDSEVQEAIGKAVIADTRPASMYEEGHVPTAVDVPFDVIMDMDGDLDENIVRAFQEAGITPDDDVIVMCQVGYHSKLAADALWDAGYRNLRYYPGSYEDWILDPTHPIEGSGTGSAAPGTCKAA